MQPPSKNGNASNLPLYRHPPLNDLPFYPDTGETGETYDMEIGAMQTRPTDNEAMENYLEFLRKNESKPNNRSS
jgi:hypothetical protein